MSRNWFERLTGDTEVHPTVVYKGKVITNPYWRNVRIFEKYPNGSAFIRRLEGNFNHLITTKEWYPEDYPAGKKEFKNWVKSEIVEEELRQCIRNARGDTMDNIREFLPREGVLF